MAVAAAAAPATAACCITTPGVLTTSLGLHHRPHLSSIRSAATSQFLRTPPKPVYDVVHLRTKKHWRLERVEACARHALQQLRFGGVSSSMLQRHAPKCMITMSQRNSCTQVGWVDARPCGVSQLCWHCCEPSEGCADASELLLAAGAADGGVTLFHHTGREFAQAAVAAPYGDSMHRLGTAVQPDMRAVTCLAMTERAVTPAESPGAAASPSWSCACLVSIDSASAASPFQQRQ